MSLDLVYIGTSRLHRNRANLIQTLQTVAAMRRSGLRAQLWLPLARRSDRARIVDLGIRESLDIRNLRLLHSRWRRLNYWPFVRFHRARLRAADVLYTRNPVISLALADAGLRHQLEIHDVAALQAEGLLDRVVAGHRQAVIEWLLPISNAARTALIDAGAGPERLHVSPSGADLAPFAAVPAFDPARLDRPRVVYLGRLSVSRGLEVFRQLAESGQAEVTLVGEQEDEAASTPGLAVMPFVPHREVPGWYARTDLVLLPYQADLGHVRSISPLKLFEAFAAGRPIVASDLPAIRELIQHERNGLLVRPDDLDGWLRAVERLRADRALALRLAQAARACAPAYSWDSRVARLAQALGWPVATSPSARQP